MAWVFQHGKKSRFWYLGWRDPRTGRAKQRSLKTTSKAEAEKALAMHGLLAKAQSMGTLDAVYLGLKGTVEKPKPLAGAWQQWIESYGLDTVTPETIDLYEDVGRDFHRHLSGDPYLPAVKDIDADMVSDYLAALQAVNARSTLKKKRAVIHAFFQHAVAHGWTDKNPVTRMKKGKKRKDAAPATSRQPFTPDEFKQLLKHAPDDFWRWMILAAFYTGQRMGDLITIEARQISVEKGIMQWTQGKTGKQVAVPIHASFQKQIEKILKRGSGHLWPDQAREYMTSKGRSAPFSKFFRERIMVPAGLAEKPSHKKAKEGRAGRRQVHEKSFHSFRHAFTSVMANEGAPEHVISSMTGMSPEIIKRYIHTSTEGLKKWVDRMPNTESEADDE